MKEERKENGEPKAYIKYQNGSEKPETEAQISSNKNEI
jgi:hypothetical protein